MGMLTWHRNGLYQVKTVMDSSVAKLLRLAAFKSEGIHIIRTDQRCINVSLTTRDTFKYKYIIEVKLNIVSFQRYPQRTKYKRALLTNE